MLEQKLEYYRQNHLTRKIELVDKKMINFSSNDYLGLASNNEVKKAFIEGVRLYGFGSTSSPLISGYHFSTQKLEAEFAQILACEDAMFFNSGYHANLGIIQALGLPIIMDKLSHASIIDGSRLSEKKFYRYHHNDLGSAYNLLKENPKSLVVTERVFSMEGDIANVDKLYNIAKKHDAKLMIDDAHGFGILENNIKADLVVIPLGKALGGMGAIAAGNQIIIEYLRQFTRSYIYSTALPPSIAHANLKALELMQRETWRIEKLKCLISLFNTIANKVGLNLASQDSTPIRAILIGDNKKAKELEQKLQTKGFFVKAIVKPTVQTARIRVSLSSNHSEKNIIDLIEAICL